MKNYEGKKIAILRGYKQLIDGESTEVEEMYHWGLKHNVSVHTYYLHAPWKRKKPEYDNGYVHSHTIFSRENIDEIRDEINSNYDLVLLINPSKPHSGLKAEDVRAFHKMYKELTPIKIQFHLTTFVKAINETPFLWSYINSSDAVFNFSSNSWYMNAIVKRLPSKKDRAHSLHSWIDVKSYEDFYQNAEREKNLTYIGRYVLYKGVGKLLDISEAVVKEGIKPVIYGMDTTIGCKSVILNHKNCNNLLQPNAPRNENPIVDTYARVSRDEVFKIFQKSMFAFTPFKFKREIDKTSYGDRLEIAMVEAIMAGSILVVDKEWAETCKTVDGVRYIDIPNFAVILDEECPYYAIQEMKKIAASPELQKLYRDTAFNIVLKEYDSEVALDILMTKMFEVTKDEEKFINDYDLVEYLTSNPFKAYDFMELYEKGLILPMVPAAIDRNKISIYTGKTGKVIREYEE